jgi:transcription initiation factor IIF auxiliary subunit
MLSTDKTWLMWKTYLGSEEAEATTEILDKIFELAKTYFNAVKLIFKLFDNYDQISQEFLRL